MVTVLHHPLVDHRMTYMRDVATQPKLFRELVSEITTFLAYEALRDIKTEEVPIQTPLPSPGPTREETPAPEKEPPAGLPAGLTAALGALKGKGEPPLLQAVGPYLDDSRRTRLARALRIASTARMAGTALQSMGGLDGL